MNGEPLRRSVIIANPQGLHMRPITAFVELAGTFQSNVTVLKGGERFNGKSPLSLLGLGAEKGTELLEPMLERSLRSWRMQAGRPGYAARHRNRLRVCDRGR